MTVAAPTKPLEVSLYVCPVCLNVGKLPFHTFGGKVFCNGPKEAEHTRTFMKRRLFREVVEQDEAVAA